MATGARRIFTLVAGVVAAGVINPVTSTAHLPKAVEQQSINTPDATLTNFVSDLAGFSDQSFVIEILPPQSTEPPRVRVPVNAPIPR
jgi:hypothetical protein